MPLPSTVQNQQGPSPQRLLGDTDLLVVCRIIASDRTAPRELLRNDADLRGDPADLGSDPGRDAWAVGDEPCVFIDFTAPDYAKRA